MPLQPLSPLEIAIHRMEQQLTAMMAELKQMKAYAADSGAPKPKRDLVFLFSPKTSKARKKRADREKKSCDTPISELRKLQNNAR